MAVITAPALWTPTVATQPEDMFTLTQGQRDLSATVPGLDPRQPTAFAPSPFSMAGVQATSLQYLNGVTGGAIGPDNNPATWTPEEAQAQTDRALARIGQANPELAQALAEKGGREVETDKGFLDTVLGGVGEVLKFTGLDKVMEIVSRPAHIAPEFVSGLLNGENLGEAAWSSVSDSLLGKSEMSWDDVLADDLGWDRNFLTAAIGFAGDIATDPLSYVTFGAGGIGREAAGKALSVASIQSLLKGGADDVGLLMKQALSLTDDAGKKVFENVDQVSRYIFGMTDAGTDLATKAGSGMVARMRKMLGQVSDDAQGGILWQINGEAETRALENLINVGNDAFKAQTTIGWQRVGEKAAREMGLEKSAVDDILRQTVKDGNSIGFGPLNAAKYRAGRAAGSALGGMRFRINAPMFGLRLQTARMGLLPGRMDFSLGRRFFAGLSGQSRLMKMVGDGEATMDDMRAFWEGGFKGLKKKAPGVATKLGKGSLHMGSIFYPLSEAMGGLTAHLSPHAAMLRGGGLGAKMGADASKLSHHVEQQVTDTVLTMQMADGRVLNPRKVREVLVNYSGAGAKGADEAAVRTLYSELDEFAVLVPQSGADAEQYFDKLIGQEVANLRKRGIGGESERLAQLRRQKIRAMELQGKIRKNPNGTDALEIWRTGGTQYNDELRRAGIHPDMIDDDIRVRNDIHPEDAATLTDGTTWSADPEALQRAGGDLSDPGAHTNRSRSGATPGQGLHLEMRGKLGDEVADDATDAATGAPLPPTAEDTAEWVAREKELLEEMHASTEKVGTLAWVESVDGPERDRIFKELGELREKIDAAAAGRQARRDMPTRTAPTKSGRDVQAESAKTDTAEAAAQDDFVASLRKAAEEEKAKAEALADNPTPEAAAELHDSIVGSPGGAERRVDDFNRQRAQNRLDTAERELETAIKNGDAEAAEVARSLIAGARQHIENMREVARPKEPVLDELAARRLANSPEQKQYEEMKAAYDEVLAEYQAGLGEVGDGSHELARLNAIIDQTPEGPFKDKLRERSETLGQTLPTPEEMTDVAGWIEGLRRDVEEAKRIAAEANGVAPQVIAPINRAEQSALTQSLMHTAKQAIPADNAEAQAAFKKLEEQVSKGLIAPDDIEPFLEKMGVLTPELRAQLSANRAVIEQLSDLAGTFAPEPVGLSGHQRSELRNIEGDVTGVQPELSEEDMQVIRDEYYARSDEEQLEHMSGLSQEERAARNAADFEAARQFQSMIGRLENMEKMAEMIADGFDPANVDEYLRAEMVKHLRDDIRDAVDEEDIAEAFRKLGHKPSSLDLDEMTDAEVILVNTGGVIRVDLDHANDLERIMELPGAEFTEDVVNPANGRLTVDLRQSDGVDGMLRTLLALEEEGVAIGGDNFLSNTTLGHISAYGTDNALEAGYKNADELEDAALDTLARKADVVTITPEEAKAVSATPDIVINPDELYRRDLRQAADIPAGESAKATEHIDTVSELERSANKFLDELAGPVGDVPENYESLSEDIQRIIDDELSRDETIGAIVTMEMRNRGYSGIRTTRADGGEEVLLFPDTDKLIPAAKVNPRAARSQAAARGVPQRIFSEDVLEVTARHGIEGEGWLRTAMRDTMGMDLDTAEQVIRRKLKERGVTLEPHQQILESDPVRVMERRARDAGRRAKDRYTGRVAQKAEGLGLTRGAFDGGAAGAQRFKFMVNEAGMRALKDQSEDVKKASERAAVLQARDLPRLMDQAREASEDLARVQTHYDELADETRNTVTEITGRIYSKNSVDSRLNTGAEMEAPEMIDEMDQFNTILRDARNPDEYPQVTARLLGEDQYDDVEVEIWAVDKLAADMVGDSGDKAYIAVNKADGKVIAIRSALKPFPTRARRLAEEGLDIESPAYREVTAFTHPDFRRKGIGDALMRAHHDDVGITGDLHLLGETMAYQHFSEKGMRMNLNRLNQTRDAILADARRNVDRATEAAKEKAENLRLESLAETNDIAQLQNLNARIQGNTAPALASLIPAKDAQNMMGMQILHGIPGFEDMAMPAFMAEEFKQALSGYKSLDGAHRAWRQFNSWWKEYATLYFPGFHVRNGMGGFFNNWLGGVQFPDYVLTRRIREAERELFSGSKRKWAGTKLGAKDADFVQAMKMNGTFSVYGKNVDELTYGDMAAIESGLGLTASNGRTFAEPRLTVEQIEHRYNEPNKYNLPRKAGRFYKRQMQRAGTVTENTFRTAAFVRGLRDTGDLMEARAFTMMRHGDYYDLTDWEYGFIRDLIPFYKWMRTNVPFQVHQLLENPAKMLAVGKAQGAVFTAFGGDYEDERKKLPEWMQQSFIVPKGLNKDDVFDAVMLDLPFADLHMGGREFVSSFLPMVRPVLESYVYEKQTFSGAPIEGKPVQMPGVFEPLAGLLSAVGVAKTGPNGEVFIDDKLQNVLSVIPIFSRMRNWIYDEPDRAKLRGNTLASSMFGLGIRPVDQEQLADTELDFYYRQILPTLDYLRGMGYPLPTSDDIEATLGSTDQVLLGLGIQPRSEAAA